MSAGPASWPGRLPAEALEIHNHLHSSDDAAPVAAPYRRWDQLGAGTAEEWRRYRVRLRVWLRPPEPTVPGGRAGRGGLGLAHPAAAARVTAAGDPAPVVARPGGAGAAGIPAAEIMKRFRR